MKRSYLLNYISGIADKETPIRWPGFIALRFGAAIAAITVMNAKVMPIRAAGIRAKRHNSGQSSFGLVTLLSIILITGRAWALDPGKALDQFNCQTWTRQSGLNSDKINAITQTKDGFIWLGTQNGLLRFDGTDFKVVPVDPVRFKGQEIRDMARAAGGGLWFAVNGGEFGKFDGQKFTAMGDEHSVQQGAKSVLESRQGALWGGSDAGISRWQNDSAGENYFEETNSMVTSLAEDAMGRVWAGTVEHGLFYWDHGGLHMVPEESLKQRNIGALAVDPSGLIWVGTATGLLCYDPKGRLRTTSIESEVKALLMDSHGVLWVATTGQGLARYEDGSFTYLGKADGLASDSVTSIFEDAEGSIWVGTLDGLSQLTDLKFPLYTTAEGICPGSVTSVSAASKGGMWITTASGLCWFDGKNVQTFGTSTNLGQFYLKLGFEAHNGDFYVEDSHRALEVVSGGKIAICCTNRNWVGAMEEDSISLLAGVGNNLYRFSGGKMTPYEYQAGQRPAFYWINNLLVARDGSIWVASNNGIFRLRNGSFKQWLQGQVNCLCEDNDGNIWAGVPGGLARIKNDELKTITEADGIVDDRIFSIVPDNLGYLWFDSGNGIFRSPRQQLNDFADGKSNRVQCDAFNGLESVKIIDRVDQQPSGCRTSDGRIWFPTPNGVVMIDPHKFYINHVAPQVHIQRVLVNGNELKDLITPAFHSGDRKLEFFFTALSYISPQKVQVQYRLAGYDPAWIDAGTRREALYTNLKPGRYTFQVRAANADNIWNDAGDNFSLELPSPFYETAWFRALVMMAVAIGVWAAYSWKVRLIEINRRKLQAQNDLLEAKVVERTKELAHERDLLRALMDNSDDRIYFKDLESRFTRCSENMSRVLRAANPSQLIGRRDSDFFSSDHALQARADELEIIRTGKPILAKIEKETWPDGRVTWVLTSKMPFHDNTGAIAGTFGISKDITGIKAAEEALTQLHKQLVDASRQAGMAEIATSVLHNVGNVLNSVNVSSSLIMDKIQRSRAVNLAKVASLLKTHKSDLAAFFTSDPKGLELPGYFADLADCLAEERQEIVREVGLLVDNITHIKEIVAMQQNYSKASGVLESLKVADLVDESLRMNHSAMERHHVKVVSEIAELPPILTDKHKVLQILVNLIRNAEHACDDSGRDDKQITLRAFNGGGFIKISVIDNGIGITPENLTRIFHHGFTTRKDGHGFGLHSGALTAKELGGSLSVVSEGTSRGATFTLALPVK